MKLVSRPATINDHNGIAHITGDVLALHADALPDQFQTTADSLPVNHFHAAFETSDSGFLVAERTGEIVGYAKLHVRHAPDAPMLVPRRYAFLDEIGVLTTEQGKGIGRQLIDAAVQWAHEQGLDRIELNVHEFDGSAIGFYERLGFTTFSRVMALSFDKSSGNDNGR